VLPDCKLRHTACACYKIRLLRREDHHDSSPLHLRRLLEFGDRLQLFLQALDQLVAFLGVSVFAAAEDDGEDDFVFLGQELFRAVDLGHQVMIADLGADPQLFVFAVMRVAFVLPLLLLVLELAKIHDSANGRLLLGRDFDKVEAKVFGTLKGVDSFQDAELVAFRSNDADRCIADLFVDPLRFTVEGDGTIS
jgi:hypothetical protein